MNTMNTMDTIFTRRSIRKYTDKDLNKEQIQALLKAGFQAPTASNLMPTHFVVIEDPKILEQISDANEYAHMVKNAKCAIVVCGDTKSQEVVGYLIADCSAATQNILLLAHSMGLGAVWCGLYPDEDYSIPLGKIINLPDHVLPVSIVAIGYPNRTKKVIDRYDALRIHNSNW